MNALARAEKELKKIANLPRGIARSQANTLEPLNNATLIVSDARDRASLLANVHPDKKVRDNAEKEIQKLSKFFPKLYSREDLYRAVKTVSPRNLDPVARRFREKELLNFKLSGIEKSVPVRREIKKMIAKMVKLGQVFDRTIKDDVRHLAVKASELEGMPADYLEARPADENGVVEISTQYPDYYPAMQHMKSGTMRKKLFSLSINRGWPKNDKALRQLLATRQRIAQLLGYKDWAYYSMFDKMAKSPSTAWSFLNHASQLAKPTSLRDMGSLLKRKKEDLPRARAIDPWDLQYYETIVAKEKIGVDLKQVREYFPFKNVKPGILGITERLFGLTYRRLTVKTWHEDVEAYDVYRRKVKIGRFYLDLHPRQGKYNHAACFGLKAGIKGRQLPEAVLVCNFSRGLATHEEVTTFLHEFGHLVHFILGGHQHWVRFSGYSGEHDFIESPSQMLEAWALDFETVKRFARHYRTGKPIPRALFERIIKSDRFGRGTWIRRQIFYSALALRYHQEKNPLRANLSGIMKKLQKKYDLITYPPGAHFYTNFGHLYGYSALYYTYPWSRAIAEDILSPFKKRGMYNKKVASEYAEKILAQGGSKDSNKLIRDFLGRKWQLKAFEKWLRE